MNISQLIPTAHHRYRHAPLTWSMIVATISSRFTRVPSRRSEAFVRSFELEGGLRNYQDVPRHHHYVLFDLAVVEQILEPHA